MKKQLYTFSLAAIACLSIAAVGPVKAQDNKGDKLGEYDEIILKRKDGKDGKVTVEIKDGEVYVDGKKIEEYKGDDITVYKRRNRPMDGNSFNFNRIPRGGMQLYQPDEDNGQPLNLNNNKAVLGVITAKEEAAGATVKEVSPGSGADKAGLKVGDVITSVNGDAIKEPQELFEVIGKLKAGDEVTVAYLRNKKQSKVKAKLGERPAGQQLPAPREQPDLQFRSVPRGGDLEELFRNFSPRGGDNESRLGLSVQDLEDGKGVKVLGVAEGSAAEEAGFKEDDIITELAGAAVNSARDVVGTYKMSKDKGTMTAKIIRDGKSQTLQVKVPKKLEKADL